MTGGVADRMSGTGAATHTPLPLWVKSRHMQCKKACPLYPLKQTLALHKLMSAKGQ